MATMAIIYRLKIQALTAGFYMYALAEGNYKLYLQDSAVFGNRIIKPLAPGFYKLWLHDSLSFGYKIV